MKKNRILVAIEQKLAETNQCLTPESDIWFAVHLITDAVCDELDKIKADSESDHSTVDPEMELL